MGITLLSPFNSKAKLWIEGRKNWREQLNQLGEKKGKRTWIHCASLGEFEQARPVIERLKSEARSHKSEIIITFFSPSGYEIRKNYDVADWVVYLPLDTKKNAKEFIGMVKPDLALFVKYEFWFHYLNELMYRKTPVILFSSAFRENQIFFKWYGGLFRSMLSMFSKIFVQNEESKVLLKSISIDSEIAFDTRFDRVWQIAENKKSFPVIKKFKADSKIFIAGSTWKYDEDLVVECIKEKLLNGYKYIIAPHNIEQTRIDKLIRDISLKARRFSELNNDNAIETDVVIIDNIGNLASLYSYAEIAYVGGGFNASVHNILEAAVYGIPVLFGPNHQKSLEAKELFQFNVHDYPSLKNALVELANENTRTQIGGRNKKFVEERLGGTKRVMEAVNFHLQN